MALIRNSRHAPHTKIVAPENFPGAKNGFRGEPIVTECFQLSNILDENMTVEIYHFLVQPFRC